MNRNNFQGLEARRSDFQPFGDTQVAHRIVVRQDGRIGLIIQLTGMSKPDAISDNTFELRGHDWTRAFTDQVR